MGCLRCGADFDSPHPEITNPEGRITEIACVDWCPGCNAIAMMAVFRNQSVYYSLNIKDPLRGGERSACS